MANSVTARFNDDCKVFVSMSDDTTVEKAVIIDAEGNETDIGGGGGESDFSTAEVTLINTSEYDSYYAIAFLLVNSENGCFYEPYLHVETELTLTVPLYKGKAKIPYAIELATEDEPITTGGVSIDENYDYIIITGDGTFSAKSISGGGN